MIDKKQLTKIHKMLPSVREELRKNNIKTNPFIVFELARRKVLQGK